MSLSRKPPATLPQALDAAIPGGRGVTYVEGESDERRVGYGELRQRALRLLRQLQERGVARGDHLVLFVRQNEAFVDAFWACALGGIVAVPVAVGMSDEHRLKLLRIATLLGRPWILSDRRSLERATAVATDSPHAQAAAGLTGRAILLETLEGGGSAAVPATIVSDDVAFIQFSSGSTSEPKGVVLTHRNLMANWRGIAASSRFVAGDSSLSWMPLTHDMGLIAMHLFMVSSGLDCTLMPTELFIRRPLLWLEAAARRRATILASPNFGYRYYLKVLGERTVDHLDLSAVRIIYNGAEPISAALVREFQRRIAPARLAPHAVLNVYGLAEASVGVSTPEPGSPMRTIVVDRHQMRVGEVPVPRQPGERDALEIVGVGRAATPCELRVVADDDSPLPEGRYGHVQIRGENVTSGYFENPSANAALHTADGWVRTGDLGLVDGGCLFITGRSKEIIFVNGQNYYPHDIEQVALQAEGLELGKVVAAGVQRAGASTDELVVFVVHRGEVEEFLPLATSVARLVNGHAGLEVADVVPVRRIPKTTSGKIQRHVLEQELRDGLYDADLERLHALREAQRGAGGASTGEIEAALQGICERALDGRRVGVRDNLFDLGASSLKLIEIHEQVDALYPGQVELTALFDHPTLADLAAHIRARLAASRR
jgi:acyl-CoA synthetase (AMP-forming)/AMP-acid ligase II